MPYQNYKSVSINSELIEHVNRLIKQVGTYHSVSEFVSEAVRLRIENLEKAIKIQEEARSAVTSNNRKTKRPA
jgi:Arc/MetJ-type ribon-helix-helix transcriptional regulator